MNLINTKIESPPNFIEAAKKIFPRFHSTFKLSPQTSKSPYSPLSTKIPNEILFLILNELDFNYYHRDKEEKDNKIKPVPFVNFKKISPIGLACKFFYKVALENPFLQTCLMLKIHTLLISKTKETKNSKINIKEIIENNYKYMNMHIDAVIKNHDFYYGFFIVSSITKINALKIYVKKPNSIQTTAQPTFFIKKSPNSSIFELEPCEPLWKNLSKNQQQQITKAIKEANRIIKYICDTHKLQLDMFENFPSKIGQ